MVESFIPYGAYWSTPFARWQTDFADLHAIEFAAWTARNALAKRQIPLETIDFGVLGLSVPQKHSFYGLPWLTGLIGAPHVGGPTISQACATGARSLQVAAAELDGVETRSSLVITADRTSNGPHIYYPAPKAPGGTGATEDWVLSNFERDPFAGVAMIATAENVAREWRIDTAEQNDVTIMRYAQYADALTNERAFHRTFMDLPFDVPDAKFGKVRHSIEGDVGIQPADPEKIRALRPVLENGTVTYAGQTHPADGNAGMIVCDEVLAHELSRDTSVTIRLLGFGLSRERVAYMPAAPVRAAARALRATGLDMRNIDAVKSHNPFVVNDIVFARETGFPIERMNNFGCSLVWGHPQSPTGLRSIIELIEELALRGGGTGLFQGCAAGDTAMAAVLRVDVAQ